jgi:hypothetical protein
MRCEVRSLRLTGLPAVQLSAPLTHLWRAQLGSPVTVVSNNLPSRGACKFLLQVQIHDRVGGE